MFVVTVTFHINPGQMAQFMPLMLAQARNSLALETGCHVFDVCQSEDNPDVVFLYELYEDRTAFDAHLASDHFRQFDRDIAEMVANKTVAVFTRRQVPD